jgi:hypothetical protein
MGLASEICGYECSLFKQEHRDGGADHDFVEMWPSDDHHWYTDENKLAKALQREVAEYGSLDSQRRVNRFYGAARRIAKEMSL